MGHTKGGNTYPYISTAPLAEYVDTIRRKTNGDWLSLAEYFNVSARNLTRYLTLDKKGRIVAKSTTVPLRFADEMLTHAGDETLHNLWDFNELDDNFRPTRPRAPRCKRCESELQKARKGMLCGFCIEETTGRTLTYRTREMY